MLNLTNIRTEEGLTHLFIPMYKASEVNWLIRKAGISEEDCYIRPWRNVLNRQVPAIKDVSNKQRNDEIEMLYGDLAKSIQTAPAVIISHFNEMDLFERLADVLFGEGDPDYREYIKTTQEEATEEESGIHVIQREA